MKPRGPDNVVYYVTAVVSALIILAYIAAGEVTPIVGFLVGGVLIFAIYPNKTVALLSAVLISAALRKPNREGFKEGEDGKTVAAPAATAATAADAAPAAAAAPATNPEDLVKKATELAKATGLDTAKETDVSGPAKDKPKDEQFVGSKKITPAELPAIGGASSPQDVEKLSLMIDKTMELLKMLPDGFLQNAIK